MRPAVLITLIALSAALAPNPNLAAQADSTAVIEGTIVDSTGRGIGNTQVRVLGTAFATTADSTGQYSFSGVPAGSYVVRANYVGFRQLESAKFALEAGQRHQLDMTMFSPNGPVTTRPVPGEPAAEPELQLRAQLAARAAQLGWPVLRITPPQASTRELRIAVLEGMIYQAGRVVRLVVRPDTVFGEITEVWWHSPTPYGPYQVRTGKTATCTDVDSVTTICRYPTSSIDWRAVADSVARLGLWESFTDVGVQRENVGPSDQDLLSAEAWSDGQYRSVTYYGPQSFTDRQTQALLAVERIFRRLEIQVEAEAKPRD